MHSAVPSYGLPDALSEAYVTSGPKTEMENAHVEIPISNYLFPALFIPNQIGEIMLQHILSQRFIPTDNLD